MKNKPKIFTRAALRQPLRSLLLFLLIAAAAFAFVLRTTEFMVIQEGIHTAAASYRTIGFLQVPQRSYGNVEEGTEMLANSPFIQATDNRRGFDGLLVDMQNAEFFGVDDRNIHGNPVRHHRQQYAYFYATLEGIYFLREDGFPQIFDPFLGIYRARTNHIVPFVRFLFSVDDVLVSFDQHVRPGQTIIAEHFFVYGENMMEGMEIGGRYLLSAGLYDFLDVTANTGITAADLRGSQRFRRDPGLIMRSLDGANTWFLPAPPEFGNLNMESPLMAGVYAGVRQQQHNHHAFHLRTTADQSAMPIFQEGFNLGRIVRGRPITREDYDNANPVVVIPTNFAFQRGLDIGDTITISVPSQQYVVDAHFSGYFVNMGILTSVFDIGNGIMDMIAEAPPGSPLAVENLELTIVGVFNMFADLPWWATWMPRSGLQWINYIYIPDSLIPADLTVIDTHAGYQNPVWDMRYSFVLNDTREEAAFISAYRDAVEGLGLSLNIIPSGSENFWLAAAPVLQSTTLNAAMFSAVLLVVLGLVSFLYLRSRRREFAIARALGMPGGQTLIALCAPLVVAGIIAATAGGIGGWHLALTEAESVLTPLTYGYDQPSEIAIFWLPLQVAAVIVVMSILLVFGASKTAGLPLLALLQGVSTKTKRKRKRSTKTYTPVLLSRNLAPTNVNFVFNHIRRNPTKSALTAITAAFFLTAFALLTSAIHQLEDSIDHLYNTTIVSGDIRFANPLAQTRTIMGVDAIGMDMGEFIPSEFVDAVEELGFFGDHFAEASYLWNFIIVPDENGNFPTPTDPERTFWEEYFDWLWVNHGNIRLRLHPFFATNNLERLMEEHGEQERGVGLGAGALDDLNLDFGDRPMSHTFPLEITFAEGLTSADFVYYDETLQTPIPVIISEYALAYNGLSLGDMAFTAMDRAAFEEIVEDIDLPDFQHTVQIIGTHNGGLNRVG
ncbi:MAG: hypothetical protein FWB98_09160, partial [Defluviitaleaceae bacterium]|nr:hypothetical protein [Defluviitaleaceae bacterium]